MVKYQNGFWIIRFGMLIFILSCSYTSSTFVSLLNSVLSVARKNTTQEITNLPTTMDLIIAEGFGYQSYRVKTKDGYILQLHRIISKNSGPPVLIQHGFSSSSEVFVMRDRNSSLGSQTICRNLITVEYYEKYLKEIKLADAGFDVWLSDQRGNWYSKKHVKYTVNDARFWNFSFHESGFYDLPATIDKILDVTGYIEVSYIGYSLGTTIFLVMASMRPEYNQKVKPAILLGPVAMLSGIYGYSLKKIYYILRIIYKLFLMNGHLEFLPRTVNIINWIKYLCKPSILQKYCLDFLIISNRENLENIDKALLSDQLCYFPAGTSLKNVHHLIQLFRKGFRQYDYGELGNCNIYKSDTPPLYPIHNITTPIVIYWAKNDIFIDSKNIAELVKKLPSIAKKYLIPDPNFSHIDFLIGINSAKLVNENVITYLQESILKEMKRQRPERNFARRITPLSTYRNRQQAKQCECPPPTSRLSCNPQKSLDSCQIDQDNQALQQIGEIKKYMIDASEFDVLEKLIDLNAPKFVVEYQMRKVEEEEQGALIDTQVNSMFSNLEQEVAQEVTQIDECKPVSAPQSTPRRNICPPARRQNRDEIAREVHRRNVRRSLFQDEPSTSHSVRSNRPDPCPVPIPSDDIGKQEKGECLCQDVNKNQDKETELLENLEKLIVAEHADASVISSYIHKEKKTCEGLTIQPALSFKETVEKNAAAAAEKLIEKEEDLQPEVAAAILHSEEKGVGLSKAPREIYESLFESYDKHVIEITPASTSKPGDVVPLPTKVMKSKQSSIEEDAALLDFTRPEEEKKFSLPEANLQEDENVENEDDLLGFVDSQILNEEAATFKVMLSPKGSITHSQVQMRGSQPPSWFPGYFVAMPDNEDTVSVEKPWTILEKAWQNFRPTKVKPRKGAIVIGT